MEARWRIRAIDPAAPAEIDLVARRMRATLVEVLGAERGGGMYTHEWLVERVRWHLRPEEVTGEVFLAEGGEGAIVGHAIVRIEVADDGGRIGLFSTIFVDPAHRRSGVAGALLRRGEAWMVDQGMTTAATYTDENNHALQDLFIRHGYAMAPMPDQFVRLARRLA